MEQNPAEYIEEGKIYHADTCAPTREASARGELKVSAIGKGTYHGIPVPHKFLNGVVSMGCWNADHDQTWKLEWHRNEGIEFTLLDQGHVYFAVDDEEFELIPEQLTITRPWQKHTVGEPIVTASRLHWIIIDVGVRQPHANWKWPDWVVLSEEEIEDLTNMLRGNENPVWTSNHDINNCFVKIKNVIDHFDEKTSETKLKLLVNEFLLQLHDLFKTSDTPLNPILTTSERTVNLFLKDLINHLDLNWTLENMAHHCAMGRTQFAIHCSKLTNQTPMKFLLKCRIEKVEEMLRDTDISITDIAYRCGFKSSQYLSTQYRKVRGTTPQDYRKSKTLTASL